jgi:hypothetical protein
MRKPAPEYVPGFSRSEMKKPDFPMAVPLFPGKMPGFPHSIRPERRNFRKKPGEESAGKEKTLFTGNLHSATNRGIKATEANCADQFI